MMPETDIWRAAQVMVKRYGEDAPLEAAKRADKMLASGDMDGLAGEKIRSFPRPRSQFATPFATRANEILRMNV